MTRKIFYVLYPDVQPYAECMNAIRLLADPGPRKAAHVTVRGPYKRLLRSKMLEQFNAQVSGISVLAAGVGTCWDGKERHTVFWEVHAPLLRQVWHRPDVPDFNPHITAYDGSSREEARQIRDILAQHFMPFFLNMGVLNLLISGDKPLFRKAKITDHVIRNILGVQYNREGLLALSFGRRLELIRQLSAYMAYYATYIQPQVREHAAEKNK